MHYFEEEQNPDPRQGEKSDPDPHRSEMSDPDTQQSEKSKPRSASKRKIRIRNTASVSKFYFVFKIQKKTGLKFTKEKAAI